MVIFAHGSGSSRFSPRNVQVAEALNHRRIATRSFDLLLPEEENDRKNVFDIELLGHRLVHVVRWIVKEPDVGRLPIGLFGRARAPPPRLSRLVRSVIASALWSRGWVP